LWWRVVKWLFLERYDKTLHGECRIDACLLSILCLICIRVMRDIMLQYRQRRIVQFAKWSQFFWTISRNDQVTRAIFMKRLRENVKTLVVLLLLHERNGQISFAIVNSRIVSNATDASTNFILSVLLYHVLFLFFIYFFFLGLIFKIYLESCITCG